jgi:hypothetical protein
MTRTSLVFAFALALAACGGDSAEPAADDGTTSGTDDDADDDDDDDDDESTTADPTDADTSTAAAESTGAELVDVPAQGIAVDFVEINQGVSVKIGADGAGVGPTERTAPVVARRNALVRAFYTLEPGFEPRAIEGRLVLEHADGTLETMSDEKTIEDAASPADLDGTFYWGLLVDTMQPGLSFRVELYEAEPGPSAEGTLPQLPEDGSFAAVGVENSDMNMRVVIVPVEYDDGAACQTSPDLSASTLQLYEDLMFMMNPLDRIEIEVRDPIQFNEPLESFQQINFILSDLRFDDGADPDVYYYGVVDACANNVDGFGGMAYDIPSDPTSMEAAYQRAASGLSLSPDFSAETFVHEIGHLQGRRHVTCNGEELGPDPSYPIIGGAIGEWGFGILDFTLRHPTVYKDYMTYCHPVWVSTFGWNKVFDVIEALTSWGLQAPPPTPSRVLSGTILPSGRELWHVVPGVAPQDREPDATLELSVGGTRVVVPAFTGEVPDAPDHVTFVAPMPVPLPTVDALVRVQSGTRRPISVPLASRPAFR